MADVKTTYGTEAQTFTITLASLATGSAREATAIDNTSNLWLDALVSLRVVLQSGTAGSDKVVYVYAYGTVDAATPVYPDAVTGSNAAITLNNPINLPLLGVIYAPTSAGTFTGGPWSVGSCFGGNLPEKWGIVVKNMTNITLSATEGDHKKLWQGTYSTVT